MRKRMVFVFLILCTLSSCVPAQAFQGVDKGKPVDIKVELGKVTEITFPTKVAKVIKGGTQDSVLIEVLDNSIYLLPKSENVSDIFVTTISGDSYPLNLRLGSDRDIKIQVGNPVKGSSEHQSNYTNVMDLMKDLLLNREPAGSTLLQGGGKLFLADKKMEIKVEKSYEIGDWRAYQLRVENLLSNAVIVPIEQISMPNLLAISCEQDMLSAKGQPGDSSKLYVITSQ
jgi:hypothetical protein